MTYDELRVLYSEAYKWIKEQREDALTDPPSAEADQLLWELGRLLQIVTAMKDELKIHLGKGLQQDVLFDAPKKAEKVRYP